jgi:NADH dehydrogenase
MARRREFGGEPDTRILILGGGFMGIYTALELEKVLRPEDRTEVTLVSPENFFLFTPMLPEVASSSIETTHAINPIRRMLRQARFVQGSVQALDTAARRATILLESGHVEDFPYDHVVIATGALTGYFGMTDVERHSFTAKTLGDALHLRNWVIDLLERADTEPDPQMRAELLTIVVAGGGLAGVEVSGEVNDLIRQAAAVYPRLTQREIRVILVELGPRLMGELSDDLASFTLRRLRAQGVEVMLNTRVVGASERDVSIVSHGGQGSLPTRTLVWTTGVAPHPLLATLDLPKDARGWLDVDAHLQVKGTTNVWAGGDCARVPDVLRPGKTHPATAQHAIREAAQLGRNLRAAVRGEPTAPFRYRTLGQMATLGHYNGVGVIGPIKVSGFMGWAAWRTYYLWRLPRLEKRLRVATDWTVDLLFGRDISQIKTYLTRGPYTSAQGGRPPLAESNPTTHETTPAPVADKS